MEDKLQILHTNLIRDGYDLPDYETFKADMANPDNSLKFHTNLLKDGYDLPDYEIFLGDMGIKKKEPSVPVAEVSGETAEISGMEPSPLATPDLTLQTPPFTKAGESIEPEKPKAKTFGEYAAAFGGTIDEGLARIVDGVDYISTLTQDAIYQIAFGKETSNAISKMRSEGTLAPALNPLRPTEAISQALRYAGRHKELPKGTTAQKITSGILEGTANVIPDIIATFAVPEIKLPMIFQKAGLKTLSKFGVVLGTEAGIEAMRESEIGTTGEKIATPLISGLEGFTTGLMFDAMGGLSSKVGQKVANRLMPIVKTTTEATDKALLQSGTTTLTNATFFGGYSSIEEYLQTGKVSIETPAIGAGMGIALGLRESGKLLYAKGINSLITAPREVINKVLESPESVEEIANKVKEKIRDVESGKSTDKEADLIAAKILANASILKATAEEIRDNPKETKSSIEESDLDPKIKEIITDKANEVIEDNRPNAEKIKPVTDEIKEIEQEFKDIKTNKSLTDTEKDIELEKLQLRLDGLKERLIKAKTEEVKEKIKPKEETKPEEPIQEEEVSTERGQVKEIEQPPEEITPRQPEVAPTEEGIVPEPTQPPTEVIPPSLEPTPPTRPPKKKKSLMSDEIAITDNGIEFKGKTYTEIDQVNEDFTNQALSFSEQNKLKQALRESQFDALQAAPRTDASEELAFDTPLPLDGKEDINFQESDLNNAMSLRNIAKDLVTNMGFKEGAQVRIGRIKKFTRKAQGLYFLDNSIIRIGNNSDLRTLTHELGHYLDHYLFNMRGIINVNNYKEIATANKIKDKVLRDIELDNLRKKHGEEIVAGVLQRNAVNKELDKFLRTINFPPKARKRIEGIAEFVYNYVIDPAFVIKETPSLYAWFEKLLDNTPQVKDALSQARKSYDLYKQQDPRLIYESHVSREKQDNSFIAGITKLFKEPQRVVYSLLNNLKYAEDLAKTWRDIKNGKAESSKDPFLALKGMLGIDGRAHQWLAYHPYFKSGNDVIIKKDIEGFLSLIKPLLGTDKFKGYEDYLIALRDIEAYDKGKPEFAVERENIAREATRLFEEQYGKKELEDFQKKLQEYNNALLDFYYESGKVSAEKLAAIKELNRYYVPFKRIFEEYETNGKMPSLKKEMLASSATPVKARKGSKRQLISPFESIVRNTYDILNASERNIANRNMVEALKDIQKYNLKQGKALGLIQKIPAASIKPYYDVKSQEVRFALTKQAPKGKIITVWENGNPTYYEVAPEYYDSLYQNEAKINEIVRVLSTPSRWLQAGAVVYDPTFPLRNIPRDQTSAWFYSKHNYNPTDFIRGIASMIKKDDMLQKWMASGGDQSFLVASDVMLSKNYAEKKVGRGLKRKWDVYKRNPLLLLQDFSRASEMGTRIGAFKNAYKKTADVYKAMLESRDISADYGIHGASMRQISPMYPFLNARTQHMRMMVKSIKDNPSKFALKGLAITAPAILNWLLNNKDDESKELYQSLPTWRRIGLWNVRIPGTDHFFPIPKGFFGVLFGSSVESFLDFTVQEDKRVVEDLPKQLFQEFSPIGNVSELVPFPIRPEIEMWANKKGYTGRTIIPEAYKSLKPQQQYFESTPEIFKKIAEVSGISPLVIEHYTRSYFGGAGIGAVNILDETLQAVGLVEKKPEDTFTSLSKLPVFKAILTERPIGSRGSYVQDFFETLDKIADVNKRVNNYIATDEDEKLSKYLSDPQIDRLYKFYIGNETNINKFRDILSKVRDLKYGIMKDDTMLMKDRQEAIRSLDDVLQNIAVKFNNAYQENKFFDLDKEIDGILKDIKDKRSDINEAIAKQKNLYNPFWRQIETNHKEIFELLDEYNGFQNLSYLTVKTKKLDEESLRIYKEKLIENYALIVKSKLGTDKKKYESYNKVIKIDSEGKETTELDNRFKEYWVGAKEKTEAMPEIKELFRKNITEIK